MPSFPRAHSERELTTKQPQALRDDADIRDDASGRTKVATDSVKKVGDAAIAWAGTVEKIQKNTALLNAKVAIQEASNNAVLDQDMSNGPLYKKQIDDVQQQVTNGLSQSVKNQLAPELDYLTNMGNIGIEYEFRKKTIVAGQAVLAQEVQTEINNPTPAGEANIERYLKEGIADNLIDPKVAQKMQADGIDDLRFNRFLQEYRADPVAAQKKFDEGAYGMTITTNERARSKLKELKTLYREAEGDRYQEGMMEVVSGEMTDNWIDQQMTLHEANPNEGITKAHGNQLRRALYKDIKTRIGSIKEYEKYKKAIDFVYSSSEYDKIKAYEMVLSAYTDGLDGEDTKMLNEILQLKKDKKWRGKTGFLWGHNAIELLYDTAGWSPDQNLEDRTNSLLSYGKKIVDGVDAGTATKEVATDQQKKEHPAFALNEDLDAVFSPTKGIQAKTVKVKQDNKE